MKFHFGELTWPEKEPPVDGDWTRIHSPASRTGYGLAILAGLMIVLALFGWLVAVSIFTSGSSVEPTGDANSSPWGALFVTLLLFIPIHEFVHALWLPRMGFSPQTMMIIWPKKLWFSVYYDGCMSRGRWLMMRLAPLVCITALTIGLLTLFYFIAAPYVLVVFLQLLFMLNGLGSGGDVVAVFWVLFRVPAKTEICFLGGKAYWRPGTSN